jgi:type IX secretion system substrate protein
MMKNYISFIIFFLFLSFGELYSQTEDLPESKKDQVAVDNFILNNSVRMYPNPVGNMLIIESKIPISKVQVFSLLGELVKEINSNFTSIQLRDLNPGIYMIKIHSQNNSITKKLIKK